MRIWMRRRPAVRPFLIGGLMALSMAGVKTCFAGTNTYYDGVVGFNATTSVYGQGPGLGSVGSVNLAQTSWSNSGVLGGITPLRGSYDFIGQTGTYCGVTNPFNGSCVLEFPSYGTVTNTVDLGKVGIAVPFSTDGKASLDLSYRGTLGQATIASPYKEAVSVTQVGANIYKINTFGSSDSSNASLSSFSGVPQASLNLNYEINAALGSLDLCAGGCTTIGGGLVSRSGEQTKLLADFNSDGSGKLVIPGLVSLDPHGENGALTYKKGGLSATLNYPNLNIDTQGAQANGTLVGSVKTTLGSIGYDICALIPYCFNRSDSFSGDIFGGFSYSASYNAYALSLLASLEFGLNQAEKFTANVINGVLDFADTIGLIKRDANGVETVENTKSIAFTPGDSFLINTGDIKNVQVSTSYSLDGTFHNRTDLTLDAVLTEAVLQASASLGIDYDIPFLGFDIKGGQSFSFGLGPLLQASQNFPIGSVNLIDKDISVMASMSGFDFSLSSNCAAQDLIVTHAGGATDVGSLFNAIQCADVMPNSFITLSNGLGTLALDDGLPPINQDVTFFNGNNTLIGFDNVRVVPEPGSVLMMLTGVGMLITLRRKSVTGEKNISPFFQRRLA